MSVKDTRYYRDCPICGDRLPGTDDAAMVFDCLKDEVEANELRPGCTLCGENVSLEEAKAIIAKGQPTLRKA